MTDLDYSAMCAPRYAGISTFMRTPLSNDPEGLDIALVGVPYDGAVEHRGGPRHGPRQMRNASTMLRSIHHVTRFNPYASHRIADLGDVPIKAVYDIRRAHADITTFFDGIHAAGVLPLSAGGDHSISLPILRALAGDGPVGMIHVDAHTDTCNEELGERYTHGTPFRRAVEEGLLDPKRTIQIGIRGAQNSTEGWDYSIESGMRVVFIEEFEEMGVRRVIAEAHRIAGNDPVYLSFDIDSIDPAFAPGTGTPEIGGLTPLEAQKFIRGLKGLKFIGADVVEVSPPFDPTGNTALVGATMMYEILCILADSVSQAGT